MIKDYILYSRKKNPKMTNWYSTLSTEEYVAETDRISDLRKKGITVAMIRDLQYIQFKYGTHEQRKAWLMNLGNKIQSCRNLHGV